MAKGPRGGRRSTVSTQQTSAQQQNTPIVQPANGQFAKMDDNLAKQLRDNADNYYTSDVRDAIKQYISKAVDNTGYSRSQTMNYALDNNLPLDKDGKFIDKYIQQGMHPIGSNVQLTRACHDDILKDLGISNYSNMTEQQLSKALVGGVYTTKSYNSFGYDDNKNPFITGPNAGGREVIIKANAPSGTKVVFGAKSQGEIITNKGTNYRIDKVYYSGKTATPRTGSSKPQVVLEVTVV